MAIGFTVGAAFTTLVKSGVEDLIMPPAGLAFGRVDFTQQYWILKAGKDGGTQFETLEQAKAAGAITLNYGNFINNCIALLVVALLMFIAIRMVKRVEDRLEEQAGGEVKSPREPDQKKCGFCMSTIPQKAVRCPQCTTELLGFRERRDRKDAAFHEIGAAQEAVPPSG